MILDYMAPLANHLWQSTLFTAVVWLITLTLRRNRAAVRHRLWLAASVKFLIPFSLLASIGSQFEWQEPSIAAPPRVSIIVGAISQPFSASELPPVPMQATAPQPGWIPGLFAGVWICGFVASLLWWSIRWGKLRRTMRRSTPLNLAVPIRVMSCPDHLEPGVFGIFRPVLLLPEGIAERLSPAQLQAVLAHELSHVQRRDNMAAAIHMFVEALFWFHPLVWWIKVRLIDEQERACDEEVLRQGADPQAYAESILKICEHYLTSPLICVSGITGSNLKKRIEDIMRNRGTLKLSPGRASLLVAAAIAALVGPIMMGIANVKAVGGYSEPVVPAVASPNVIGEERLVSPQTAQLQGPQTVPANPTAPQAGTGESARTPGVIQEYRIGEIKVTGANVLHNDVIRSSLGLASGDVFNESLLGWRIANLGTLYRSLGYVKFRAEPALDFDEQQKVVNLTVNIDEDRQFIVGEIRVTGARVIPSDVIRSLLGLASGDVFNESLLGKGFEDLMRLYGSMGFVNFLPEPVMDFDEQQKTVNLTVRLDEGSQFTVNRISFTGNTATSDEVIRREISVKEGQIFNTSAWNLSVLRLNQLGRFEEIKEEDTRVNPLPSEPKIDVILRVKEKAR